MVLNDLSCNLHKYKPWTIVYGQEKIQIFSFMKIGELATMTEVSRDTVRLYEQMGLLGGVSRPFEYNNYKDYSAENVDRIQMIRHMQKLGFTLKEIKEVFKAIEGNQFGQEEKDLYVKKKMDMIDEKIKELKKIKSQLNKFLHATCSKEDLEAANLKPATIE